MKTQQATDDSGEDPYATYRHNYKTTMFRVASVLRKAGQFGGRK